MIVTRSSLRISLFGGGTGFNRINFNTDDSIDANRILTVPNKSGELQQHLEPYFTGFSRTASEMAQEQLKDKPAVHCTGNKRG